MDVGVANERLLKKMQRELERASAQQKSGGNWRRHIERVHLLSELLLEEEPENTSPSASASGISEAEMKAMLGEGNQTASSSSKKQSLLDDDDDVNGDSIFDF